MTLKNKQEKHIGKVGVDSGQLLICDPCYIDDLWMQEEFDLDWKSAPVPKVKGRFSYAGVCETTLSDKQAGQLYYQRGHAGIGVAFGSGLGDGVYDVYATYADVEGWGRRIVSVRIDLVHSLLMKT